MRGRGGPLARRIDTVGYVDYDESEVVHVHLHTDGWIERLYVETLGDQINKGDRLFELYSPDLVNAQQARRASGDTRHAQAQHCRSFCDFRSCEPRYPAAAGRR